MNRQPQTTATTTDRKRMKDGPFASLRAALRTRGTDDRRAVARKIASYPATRSVSTAVLPADRRAAV